VIGKNCEFKTLVLCKSYKQIGNFCNSNFSAKNAGIREEIPEWTAPGLPCEMPIECFASSQNGKLHAAAFRGTGSPLNDMIQMFTSTIDPKDKEVPLSMAVYVEGLVSSPLGGFPGVSICSILPGSKGRPSS
jgi:hypothetical protein